MVPPLRMEKCEAGSSWSSIPGSTKLRPLGSRWPLLGLRCQVGPGLPGASSWGMQGAFGRCARQEAWKLCSSCCF